MSVIFLDTAFLKAFDSKFYRNYRQGESGEIAVGQYLDRMRSDGAQILHDIPGDGFNLDHVIMSPKGLFVIETKTRSKPDNGKAVITYDGETLIKDGSKIPDDSITQTKAAADYLAELLEESTGKKFAVQPVLSAKAIPNFILQLPDRLRDDEVSLANFHLSQYVRASG